MISGIGSGGGGTRVRLGFGGGPDEDFGLGPGPVADFGVGLPLASGGGATKGLDFAVAAAWGGGSGL